MATAVHFDGQDYDLGGIEGSSLMRWLGTANGPASYATGGFDLADIHSDLTGHTIVQIMCLAQGDKAFKADVANQKVLCIVPSTGVEVAAATDLSAVDLETIIWYQKA